MSYQVLARKWRPSKFSEVVGQEHVVKSLISAIQHDRLHHAYLFTGTRGVGKTTLARILAKAINCEYCQDDANPCGECSTCLAIDGSHFPDLIEVDAASRTKVEDTRDLLDNVQYAPNQGHFKIYLIDEVHMLSSHSFNSLLKTLEEPPAHVKFLLATTDPQKIPVTVLSRCLQFNLKHLYPDQIQPQLQFILDQEQIQFETPALQLIAQSAEGSMRDALSLLDQAIVHGDGQVNTKAVQAMLGTVTSISIETLLRSLANQDASAILKQIASLAEFSSDFLNVTEQLLQMLHQIAIAQVLPAAAALADAEQSIRELAQTMSQEDVQLYYQMSLMGRRDLKLAPSLRAGFEILMLRMLVFRPADAKTVSSPKLVPQTPLIDNPAPVQPVNQPVLTNNSQQAKTKQANTSENWSQMIQAMKIGGMTRELANNCVLGKLDDQTCTLFLDPGHKQLLGATTEKKLDDALQKHLGRPIKLFIEINTISADTPSIQINRAHQGRQTEAQQMINEDENIQALKDKFDARVLLGSIKPI